MVQCGDRCQDARKVGTAQLVAGTASDRTDSDNSLLLHLIFDASNMFQG